MLEEVRNNGLYIANGMNGDEEGEFIYVGPRGTTIDYLNEYKREKLYST